MSNTGPADGLDDVIDDVEDIKRASNGSIEVAPARGIGVSN